MSAPGFLDESYGVEEERRGRKFKRIARWVVLGALVGGLAAFVYYNPLEFQSRTFQLRTLSQKRVVDRFFQLLHSGQYGDAYAMWGDSPEKLKYYPHDKFLEDWGPQGTLKNATVENADVCGVGSTKGVVFTLVAPGQRPEGLWVDMQTGVLSFGPGERCPGRHWQWQGLIKRIFG